MKQIIDPEYDFEKVSRDLAKYGFQLTGVDYIEDEAPMGIEELVLTVLKDENPYPRHISGLITALNNGEVDYQRLHNLSVSNNIQNRTGWILETLATLLRLHEQREPANLINAIKKLEDVMLPDETALDSGFDFKKHSEFVDSRRGPIERKWKIMALFKLEYFQEHFLLYHSDLELNRKRKLISEAVYPGDPRYPEHA